MRGRRISQVALLVSLAFWTWLWGPLGLLMATPLTVCLVVLGKHVPGLEFVGMLMADTPRSPPVGYYQRLLARNQGEAADLIEQHIKTKAPRTVYDALLLPALNYAERDRLEQRYRRTKKPRSSMRRENSCPTRRSRSGASSRRHHRLIIRHFPERGNRCACWAGDNGVADELALEMLGHVLDDLPIVVEITKGRMPASEVVSLVQAQGVSVVCLADLPPSPPSKRAIS